MEGTSIDLGIRVPNTKSRDWIRQYRRIVRGLCVCCSSPELAPTSTRRCAPCLERQREWNRRSRGAKRQIAELELRIAELEGSAA